MNYNVIANFEYDGKMFVYYIDSFTQYEEIKLLYGYYNLSDLDMFIKPVTDIDEISMMNYLSHELFISNDKNNHVKIGTIKYNKKIFQIMYDKVTGFKFFYEIIDNEYCIPNYSDLLYLVNEFNSNKYMIPKLFEVVELKEGESLKPYIKSNVFIGFTLVSVTLFIGVCFLPVKIIRDKQYEIDKASYYNKEIVSVDEITREDIVEALNNNKDLSKEEKNVILEYSDIMVQNARYIDSKKTLEALSKLEVKYIDHPPVDSTQAYVNSERKEIRVFNSSSFEDVDKHVFGHEVGHAVTLGRIKRSLGHSIHEACTEVIQCEKDNYSYDTFMPYLESCCYLKILCEIIGSEPVLAYHFTGNIFYIIDALKKLIPDEEKAYTLISMLDNVLVYSSKYSEYDSILNSTTFPLKKARVERKVNEFGENIKENTVNIYNEFNEYFKAQYGYDMSEDVIISAYYNAIGLGKSLGMNKVAIKNHTGYIKEGDAEDCCFITPINSIKKGYFIEEYKNEYEDAIVNVDYLTWIIKYEQEYVYDGKIGNSEILTFDIDGDHVMFVKTRNEFVINSSNRRSDVLLNDSLVFSDNSSEKRLD